MGDTLATHGGRTGEQAMTTIADTNCRTTTSAGESTGGDDENPPEQTGAVLDIVAALPGDRARGLDLQWIRVTLAAALDHVERRVACVTVKIVDDARMRDLHERHRGSACTTDVLTFDHSDAQGPVEADIVLCLDEAARRAAELGHSIERELVLYALHGVLHCAGFDDRTPEDFEAMHAEEDRILTAVGVGRTFDAGRASTPAEDQRRD